MPTELYILLIAVLLLQAGTLFFISKKQHGSTNIKQSVKKGSDTIIVDTCALIDGRIQDLLNAGFITGQLYIPRRVIEELQYLADYGDAHKRSRARYGLDVVQNLQEKSKQQVSVLEDNSDSSQEVDDVLIELAQKYEASLYTTDYNLNKVARIRDVQVLNVNELAHALRPIYLPGESVTVKIVQKGEGASQGVGYLEDGTMTVMENASGRIGQHVTGEVERMLQTEAGKMMFARAPRKNHTGNSQNKQQRNKPQSDNKWQKRTAKS